MSTSPPPTRIPEKWLDIPSQRLYIISIALLCQAFKLLDFFTYLATSWDVPTSYAKKWLIVDLLYVLTVAYLRVPRITFTRSVLIIQVAALWFLDGLLFGAITLNLFGGSAEAASRADLAATPISYGFLSLVTLGLLGSTMDAQRDSHLLGQHTIRMSPISTAKFNPSIETFCLQSPSTPVFIPILLNNTNPVGLAYTITPLGQVVGEGKSERVVVTAKDLKAMEQSHQQLITQSVKHSGSTPESSSPPVVYEYDDDDDETDSRQTHSSLQKTQSMLYLRVTRPGTIQLERVRDASNVDARISPFPARLTVARCPGVEFSYEAKADKGQDVRCAGKERDVEMAIDVKGVPPLSLRWYKSLNGKRESFLVEGIEGDAPVDADSSAVRASGVVQSEQTVRVQLSASLSALGRHVYVLEEVVDALGNVVRLDSLYSAHMDRSSWDQVQTETTRSLSVLPRPAVSFRSCGPNKPVPMKIGKSAPLTLAISAADALDAPWEIEVEHAPEDRAKAKDGWKKTFATTEGRLLTLDAEAPGSYSIVDVRGKFCEGDILAPETCTVFEQPLPTAEVSWERLHECSGDIGVSATVVLHGTPPFLLYYTQRKDNGRPEDKSPKTISTFRGEVLLKPEQSGKYVYTFTHVSDANYRKVELKNGDYSIEQVVHPPAAARFAGPGRSGNAKRRISSCEGNVVDVDVELSGNGPLTLELQIVGPQGSEILKVPDIKSTKKTVRVQVPKLVDQSGGSFEIDLVSIEDSNGCKRSLSAPGISVDVRRVKPTAKFYAQNGKRQVTVTARETVELPLRLTGEKPWELTYRRLDGTNREKTVTIDSPNGVLRVSEDGAYEIVKVSDAQCSGVVIESDSKYSVDWIPRPLATLSATTPAEYEPHNNSHILRPICAGVDDHVELDLTGKAPFQIMYNIARARDTGNSELIDRPIFNSIQPRTRFQLHTTNPGRMFYEVKQIGDVAYPLEKHKDAVIPPSQRLIFEQLVFKRPSAAFRSKSRVGMCLGDAFVLGTSTASIGEGSIMLNGSPPFKLSISVKDLSTSRVEFLDVETTEYIWKINLPRYTFSSVGPHRVTIESVQDSSGCAHETLDPAERSIWVDITETAWIMPTDGKTDYCVGDVSQFQLEGTPPWTVGYKVNGKQHTQEAKSSPFYLMQQQPGEFIVNSVAHQQKRCKAAVADLRFNVHQLPSAQVGHGKRIIQDIHEGDQAEILFTLIGEPPFTFTYQRSESTTRKGQRGRVLETHTVSRVNTHEYSIYSALEGTWTVVSIADKYCRYPPLQQDVS